MHVCVFGGLGPVSVLLRGRGMCSARPRSMTWVALLQAPTEFAHFEVRGVVQIEDRFPVQSPIAALLRPRRFAIFVSMNL